MQQGERVAADDRHRPDPGGRLGRGEHRRRRHRRRAAHDLVDDRRRDPRRPARPRTHRGDGQPRRPRRARHLRQPGHEVCRHGHAARGDGRPGQAAPGVAAAWETDIEDVDVREGIVYRVSDPENEEFQMTIEDAVDVVVVVVDDVARPAEGTIVGSARAADFEGVSQKTFGAGFYEVEVDPATGFVRVIEAVQVHDVGRAINPMGVINQIHGGVMHGINKALTEELIYDPPTGVVVNPNLDEYKLHMIDGMPERVQVDFVEPYDVVGPYGAKGVGEPALLPASPAIHAAIYDAVGVYVNRQPMTQAAVLRAIAEL
ncbi:MAG: molybdopterin-dependent oxidoreductase [Dehalococcoidia bacterium]|nr:molybdopterin-dependent oxidoreductase [Dehalococcoidia bacterium]